MVFQSRYKENGINKRRELNYDDIVLYNDEMFMNLLFRKDSSTQILFKCKLFTYCIQKKAMFFTIDTTNIRILQKINVLLPNLKIELYVRT